jgi:bifunctional DNA-binding transcriptional regulator/antitoxin component of YhaV-PrlF toxin-antitoxin module
VVIPKRLREKYGLVKGTRVQVVDCGDVLALLPLPSDPVEALHGMLKVGPSLTEELLAERARERSREEERPTGGHHPHPLATPEQVGHSTPSPRCLSRTAFPYRLNTSPAGASDPPQAFSLFSLRTFSY